MSDHETPDYYLTRERQARELAELAVEPQVRRVHLDMADRYAKLLEEARAATPDGAPPA